MKAQSHFASPTLDGDPGYVPYAIGMFGVRFAALEYADERLRRDRVGRYRGLIMFLLGNAQQAMELGEYGLSLPLHELNSH